jgi:hypothetical protein
MQEMHNVPMARHYDEKTMIMILSKNFYWHEMKKT